MSKDKIYPALTGISTADAFLTHGRGVWCFSHSPFTVMIVSSEKYCHIGTMKTTRPFSRAIDLLRQTGLRPTRQRLALARLLFESGDRHITAERLHEEAGGASVDVSLATVYNTLHQFVEAGLLREIVVDSGRSYFDTNTSDHHHFFFEGCGRLEDIPAEKIVVSDLPAPPEGTRVKRVDVIVRIGYSVNAN